MALGDGDADDALAAGWDHFCDRLKAAGRAAFKDSLPTAALQRVDALRMLTQNLGQAFDLALETRDTRFPLLHAFCGPTRKLGSDCADFAYHQAWIDGAHVYRLSGERGSARFFNVTVQGPRPERLPSGAPPLHDPFGDVPEANLMGDAIEVGPDGRFEIIIGGPERAGNWLPTTPGTRKLFIRQGFDRWDEAPALLHIERIGIDAPRPVPTPETMLAAMDWAGDFLTGVMRDWPDWSFAHGGVMADRPNVFPGAQGSDAGDARRGRAATDMLWRIAPDEALIVAFPAHEGLWMLTAMGASMTSMDYLYRPVSYTPSRTAVDADGRIRLILTQADPGYANWIDSQGFAEGHLTYRHMLAGAPAVLDTQLVKTGDLADALPADSARITPQQRVIDMQRRFTAICRRYRL